jgi:hypothetical protein
LPPRRFRNLALALAAAAVTSATSAAPAQAQTTYYLRNVTFSDGTAVNGSFSVNSSGYPAGYNFVTTDGDLTGYHYNNDINVSYNPGDSTITFFHSDPSYDGFLTLTGHDPIDSVTVDPLVFGGASLECSSYSCPSGVSRNIVSGFLTTAIPEPATWAMMLVGFGGVGGTLRLGRRKVLAAA